jgi:AcrR family transcriptional regulator
MTDTREPIQKRSIEKKLKILEAGFELFCEKGYYKTNTIEIAKRAGASTGAVYSYFKDKRHIYIAAFESYLNPLSAQLLEKLELLQQPFSLNAFIENWITFYVELYADAGRALVQLRMMIMDDEEINHHFSDLENAYFINIAALLNKNGIVRDNLFEKVYASCILIDALRQEKTAFSHNGLNYDILKQQVMAAVINLLST